MTTSDTAAGTMRVRIRDRWKEGPWGVGLTNPIVRRVTISDRCPECGGPRGEPRNLNQCDDGAHYSVDVWDNPCGHLDLYVNVAKEADALADRPTWTFDPAAVAPIGRAIEDYRAAGAVHAATTGGRAPLPEGGRCPSCGEHDVHTVACDRGEHGVCSNCDAGLCGGSCTE